MEREDSKSLNVISQNAAFKLVKHFMRKVDLDTVSIDTVGKETKY